jgi:mRNA interferase MazF
VVRFRPADKRRPVLVLTRDSALDVLGEATIAPITTTVRNIPSEVLLTEADGMPETCAINLDHIQTVQRTKLGALIITLKPEKLDQVRTALLFALGFKAT